MDEEDFSNIFADLVALLKITIGPQGRAALVAQGNPRQLSLTRSGPELINLFKGCHPLLDLVLKDVLEARESLGEGSKRYLLTIQALLPLLGERRQAIMELGKAARIWEMEVHRDQEADFEGDEALREQLDAVVFNSLRSSFPLVVATQLSSLLSHHLDRAARPNRCLIDEVENLVRELPHQVVQVHRASLASSYSGNGTLLQAALSKTTSFLTHNMKEGAVVRLIILSEEEPEEAILSLGEEGMGAVSSAAWERLGRQVDRLLEANVQLLVFGKMLAERWKQRLALHDVALVERAGNEEVASLGRALRVIPWVPNTTPTLANIATVTVKPVMLGEQVVLHLESEEILLHHLVIAGPTAQLAASYSKAAQDSLRCAALLADRRLRSKMGVRPKLEALGKEHGSELLLKVARVGFWGCGEDLGAEPAVLEERLVACVLSTLQRVARIEAIVPCRAGRVLKRLDSWVGKGEESEEED